MTLLGFTTRAILLQYFQQSDRLGPNMAAREFGGRREKVYISVHTQGIVPFRNSDCYLPVAGDARFSSVNSIGT